MLRPPVKPVVWEQGIADTALVVDNAAPEKNLSQRCCCESLSPGQGWGAVLHEVTGLGSTLPVRGWHAPLAGLSQEQKGRGGRNQEGWTSV